jgi:hypothetical protein
MRPARCRSAALTARDALPDFNSPRAPNDNSPSRFRITSYADLVQWSGYAHMLAEDQVAALLRTAAQHPHKQET